MEYSLCRCIFLQLLHSNTVTHIRKAAEAAAAEAASAAQAAAQARAEATQVRPRYDTSS